MTQEEKDKTKRIKEAKKLLKKLLTPKTPEEIKKEQETQRLIQFAKIINPFENKPDNGYSNIPKDFSPWSKGEKSE